MIIDHYKILGIGYDATQFEIKVAYFKLIKAYHPDLNPRKKDATRHTQLLNEAYETLSNIRKKSVYDNKLRHEYENKEDEQNDNASEINEVPDYCCEICGVRNHTLRITAFLYVISVFFFTNKKGWVKILCNKCRIKYSLLWNLEVWLFGWWGFPYGPIYSIEALYKNSIGGIQPESNNISLLKFLVYSFYKEGNYEEAFHSLKGKMKIDSTQEDASFLKYISAYVRKRKLSVFDRILKLPLIVFNVPFLFLLLFGTIYLLSSGSSGSTKEYSRNERRYEFTGFETDENVKSSTNQSSNTPDKKEETTTQNEEPVTKLFEKELPRNGAVKFFRKKKAIAPFEIETNSYVNYYVKIVDYFTNELVQTIFIRSGKTIKVKVPLGTYTVKYATGSIWYGEDLLFGPYTMYYKADAKLTFEVTGNRVNGYKMELYAQPNGNLETESLEKYEF
jgi:curved DNA-binding protein CbpA